jgi:hypothetical protein
MTDMRKSMTRDRVSYIRQKTTRFVGTDFACFCVTGSQAYQIERERDASDT